MPETPTACPLDCPDSCGVVVETDDNGRFVSMKGNRAHGYSKGVLCHKTRDWGIHLDAPYRLERPLVRNADGVLEVSSWGTALDVVAERVRGVRGDQILAAYYAGSLGLVQRKFPFD